MSKFEQGGKSEKVRSKQEGEASPQPPKYQEVALKFSSRTLREGLTILFDRNIPHWLVGDKTVVLSSEHTTLFKPLKPSISELLSAGDLPPEEIAMLRREHLSFQDGGEQPAQSKRKRRISQPSTNPSLTVARYMILRLFISMRYRWYPMYLGCLFCLFMYVEFFRICLQ